MQRLSDIYTKLRTPKTPRTFTAWVRSATTQLRGIEVLCDGDPTNFQDAIPLLHGAWNDLEKAISLVTTSPTSHDMPTVPADAYIEPDGDAEGETEEETEAEVSLSSIAAHPIDDVVRMAAEQRNWLQDAAARYYKFESDHLTRQECEDALAIAYQAVTDINQWYHRRHIPTAHKWLRQIALVPIALICLMVIATIAYGGYEFATRPGERDGLSATYFSERNFMGHPFMWVDQGVDFDWQKHAPFKTMKPFSVRWEGCIRITDSAKRIRIETTEMPYSIKMDNAVYVEQKTIQGTAAASKSKPAQLPAPPVAPGTHQIVVEMSSVNIPAEISLQWSAGNEYSAIPATFMIPIGGNAHGNCKFSAPPEKAPQKGGQR